MTPLFLLVVIACSCQSVFGLTAGEWRLRSIYQIVTDRFALANGTTPACSTAQQVFCGGDLQGIINHLDYIQGMGFDAVWVSPFVANILNSTIVGQAYHGYWPSNHLKIAPTATLLQAFSSALHARSMALMADFVVNHVAFPLATANSTFDPTIGESSPGAGNGLYGVFDASADYHPACAIQDGNQTSAELCWLSYPGSVELTDLNTTSSTVKTNLYANVKSQVSTYSFDGIRIDAAMNVDMAFLEGFASSAGVFSMGEVFDGDALFVNQYQISALPSTLNYPIYFPLTRAFTSTSGSIVDLANMIGTVSYWFPDSTVLGGFAANHDNPRPRSVTTDASLLKNLFTYSFVTDGIPIWYYGDEQNASGGADPANREALWTLGASTYDTTSTLYIYVTLMNAVRKAAGAFSLTFYTNKASVAAQSTNSIAISKYPLLSVLNNHGASQSGSESLSVPSGYSAGTSVVEVLTCTTYTVGSSGNLAVTITGGQPQIFMPVTALPKTSSFCPNVSSAVSCASKTAARSSATATASASA